MKKALAFICVLALVVSMCSAFSFAAEPEPDVKVPQEGTRTGGVHYKVRTATHMYVGYGTGGYACTYLLPVGKDLVKINDGNGTYYKMMCDSYVGYVLASCLTEQQ